MGSTLLADNQRQDRQLMSACCECGALIGGASSRLRLALAEYGREAGLAFQITDDILDIEGDPAVTGKDVGLDLMHGKFTLPVLLAASGDDPRVRRSIIESAAGSLTREQALDVAGLVVRSGAVDAAREVALGHAKTACAGAGLPRPERIRGLVARAGVLCGWKGSVILIDNG